jgi:hypothetical protein
VKAASKKTHSRKLFGEELALSPPAQMDRIMLIAERKIEPDQAAT